MLLVHVNKRLLCEESIETACRLTGKDFSLENEGLVDAVTRAAHSNPCICKASELGNFSSHKNMYRYHQMNIFHHVTPSWITFADIDVAAFQFFICYSSCLTHHPALLIRHVIVITLLLLLKPFKCYHCYCHLYSMSCALVCYCTFTDLLHLVMMTLLISAVSLLIKNSSFMTFGFFLLPVGFVPGCERKH